MTELEELLNDLEKHLCLNSKEEIDAVIDILTGMKYLIFNLYQADSDVEGKYADELVGRILKYITK